MATNTCISVITYQNATDWASEPFATDRETLSEQMFNQGKTASSPNGGLSSAPIGKRAWVDHAAAQEFIDWVVATAPTYNMTLVSTSIEDLA